MPHQVPAALGDRCRRRGSPSAVSTSQTRSNCRAMVLVRCSTRRRRVFGVPVQLEPALGPAGVVLAVGALVARVRLAARPRSRSICVVRLADRSDRRAPVAVAAGRRRGQVVGPRSAARTPGRGASAGCGR